MLENPGEASAAPKKVSVVRPVAFVLLLAVIIFLVRLFDLQQYVEEERLRQAIAPYGMWGPAIFLVVWIIAPALFLPGLPITLAGGLLFGPVWGVVYTAIGATLGATLAFLVARYLARDWVAAKLSGTKLTALDNKVARQGWKVVAFTRLIPIFPFFLLNYAFGLTRISLTAFVVATFFCMLPGTVAYVYFSSHILDLFRGEVSRGLVIGIILVIIVSLIPVLYKKLKTTQGEPLDL